MLLSSRGLAGTPLRVSQLGLGGKECSQRAQGMLQSLPVTMFSFPMALSNCAFTKRR